ncbi:MAG: ester cyclase [Gammaproteobacteria bacterium]
MFTEKEIVTGFINAAFKRDGSWEDVAQYADGDGKYTHPILPIPTIRELYNGIVSFRSVFPDLHQTVQTIAMADNGHVIVKTQASATFSGDCGNIKANGKRWNVPVYWEFELENGKITSASELGNHHAINEQLGVALFKSPFEQAKEAAVVVPATMFGSPQSPR